MISDGGLGAGRTGNLLAVWESCPNPSCRRSLHGCAPTAWALMYAGTGAAARSAGWLCWAVPAEITSTQQRQLAPMPWSPVRPNDHEYLDAARMGLTLLDATADATEQVVLRPLAETLSASFPEVRFVVGRGGDVLAFTGTAVHSLRLTGGVACLVLGVLFLPSGRWFCSGWPGSCPVCERIFHSFADSAQPVRHRRHQPGLCPAVFGLGCSAVGGGRGFSSLERMGRCPGADCLAAAVLETGALEPGRGIFRLFNKRNK